MIGSIFRFLGKIIGLAILIFVIYFILGCYNAAFQGIITPYEREILMFNV